MNNYEDFSIRPIQLFQATRCLSGTRSTPDQSRAAPAPRTRSLLSQSERSTSIAPESVAQPVPMIVMHNVAEFSQQPLMRVKSLQLSNTTDKTSGTHLDQEQKEVVARYTGSFPGSTPGRLKPISVDTNKGLVPRWRRRSIRPGAKDFFQSSTWNHLVCQSNLLLI